MPVCELYSRWPVDHNECVLNVTVPLEPLDCGFR